MHELNESERKWQSVWQQHCGWLKTVLTARVRDTNVAEDLLQEVAVVAWRKKDQLRDHEKVSAWLYRIAIRQVQMFWRRSSRPSNQFSEMKETDLIEDEGQRAPIEWVISDEANLNLRKVLAELPRQDREILMLKYTEEWTFKQIAERLDITFDKVIYRLARAKNRLRQKLAVFENQWAKK